MPFRLNKNSSGKNKKIAPNIVIPIFFNDTINLLFEKISTGFSQGQPLNCHAGPMTNTATTRSQSAALNFAGLSITRYGTDIPFFCRCNNTSLSRLAPSDFFCSTEINLQMNTQRKKAQLISMFHTLNPEESLSRCAWRLRK